MEVVLDAGAGRFAEIDPDVDALRFVGMVQRHLRQPREVHQLGLLFRSQRFERRKVPVGHDHQVSVVVWVEIEDDVAALTTQDDEVEIAARRRVTEDAGGCGNLSGGHIAEAPRRP